MPAKATEHLFPARRGDYAVCELDNQTYRVCRVLSTRNGRVYTVDFGHGSEMVWQRCAIIPCALPSMETMIGKDFPSWKAAREPLRPHVDHDKRKAEAKLRDPLGVAPHTMTEDADVES